MNEILTVAPVSPVPEIVKTPAFSVASIMSSVAIALIPTALGTTLSIITPFCDVAPLVFPFPSFAVTATV